MYGTTMRNYNANRASGTKDEKKSVFSKKSAAKENKRAKKNEDTRYMKLESSAEITADEIEVKEAESGFSRKDFPIASVIVTVLLTMMVLILGSGFFGA
ncbi:MAG: hypothetical protein IJC80_03275 [Clostridia bacterium]|nr:hypothetical protein [Clostridia bacterium]